jgi:regulator of cell morphogenesis and NO signaling
MLDPRTAVATIVLEHSECASVFDRHRIDYCCRGARPLADVCEDRGLDVDEVIVDLEQAIARRRTDAVDPRLLSTRSLITDVIARHHRYLHRTLPELRRLADKVARVHGDKQPDLLEVARLVHVVAGALDEHLEHEERVLFPAMLRGAAPPGELATMEAEHEQVGELLADLRTAAGDYHPPDFACPSYRTLLRELAALEADTLRHVHVENHVLAPRFTAG